MTLYKTISKDSNYLDLGFGKMWLVNFETQYFCRISLRVERKTILFKYMVKDYIARIYFQQEFRQIPPDKKEVT